MKLPLFAVLITISGATIAAPTAGSMAPADARMLEERCRDMYGKGAPPDAVLNSFQYAGRDGRDRHLVKGSATIQGKEHPVQCAFDAEPAPAPTDRKK